eukprot:scaffold247336_cov34-Prasinocladus_malaysianus.AAC.1
MAWRPASTAHIAEFTTRVTFIGEKSKVEKGTKEIRRQRQRAQLQVGRAVVLGINCAEAIAIKAVLRHVLWYDFRHSHVQLQAYQLVPKRANKAYYFSLRMRPKKQRINHVTEENKMKSKGGTE